MRSGASLALLRGALIVAALAALLVLTGMLGDALRYGCLALIALAALLTATERRRPGGTWWNALGAGAALSLAGAGLAEASDAAGGLVIVVGGALVVIAATVGFPVED